MGFWALLEAVDELKPAVPRFHVQVLVPRRAMNTCLGFCSVLLGMFGLINYPKALKRLGFHYQQNSSEIYKHLILVKNMELNWKMDNFGNPTWLWTNYVHMRCSIFMLMFIGGTMFQPWKC
jgi:hypothetical protein